MSESIKVEKIVNGKAVEIKNAIAAAKIVTFAMASRSSGEFQKLLADSEFCKMVIFWIMNEKVF